MNYEVGRITKITLACKHKLLTPTVAAEAITKRLANEKYE